MISLVNGFLDHAKEDASDSGFGEWLDELNGAMSSRSGWTVVKSEPSVDLSSFDINGKKVRNLSFEDLVSALANQQAPSPLSYSDFAAFKAEAGKRLTKTWLTVETKTQVSIGGKSAQPLSIQLLTYFGAGTSAVPHKKGIKEGDVFIYNGHSYIGYGPLDPRNFTKSDFPSSYQLLFIDGCVSYNYYEKDYVPLKTGGTTNLDLITNGLEAPAWRSGYALGEFVGKLIDGTQPSYLDLLESASVTDSLRVVDGELDNKYSPTRTPIRFR